MFFKYTLRLALFYVFRTGTQVSLGKLANISFRSNLIYISQGIKRRNSLISKICHFVVGSEMSLVDENWYKQFVGQKHPPFDCKHHNYHITFPSVTVRMPWSFTHAILLSCTLHLSHIISLCLSAIWLSPTLFSSHIKKPRILSLIINCFNKVVWCASHCFTYKRLITILGKFQIFWLHWGKLHLGKLHLGNVVFLRTSNIRQIFLSQREKNANSF